MELLIITQRESDLSHVLKSCGVETDLYPVSALIEKDISAYDCFAVIGGTQEENMVLDARMRAKLEEQTALGKKIYLEYNNSYGHVYSDRPKQISHHRLVYAAPAHTAYAVEGLETGDILDDHYNHYIKPWVQHKGAVPLLVYHDYVPAHSHWSKSVEEIIGKQPWAMWFSASNILMTAFRLCDFNQARLAPQKKWHSLITFIAKWLTGNEPAAFPTPVCQFIELQPENFDATLDNTISAGIQWLKRYLADGGKQGILEGLTHHILPDGTNLVATTIRTDCAGEAGGAFRLHGLLYNDQESHCLADTLEDFCFGPMQVHEGIHKGMVRWTETAWDICYQDDVARAILPTLLYCVLTGERRKLDHALDALDFLTKTTSKDGIRISRTSNSTLDEDEIKRLQEASTGTPSAHYNAYYHATLLLGYLCTGKQEYLDMGRKGLESLMAMYPETRREQSETEEMCRLIFPLACLYGVTKEKFHYDLLNRVCADLEKHRHPFGGYCEWDMGYKATYARKVNTECSLLAENGDPVADLLYSTNWLSLGFAYAYMVTKEQKFKDLWHNVASFFIRTQIHSENKWLDGGWCRAFDMDTQEIYGVPHDVGWAACCIESGWTVSEILLGLQWMQYIEKK
ncbi:MAG TPA: hypothetical protein DCY75_06250 [Clostridiales bacterium]|nr:hypothetical protein [Clostridiales bacterium]